MNNKKIIFFLKRLHSVLTNFGINLLRFKKIFQLPKFFSDFFKFKILNGKIDYLFPIIGEHAESGGYVIPHYFNQDIIVASYIFINKPLKHVDVGSRLDGFISHVASFREIEVFDIRNIETKIKNIKFKKLDINQITSNLENYTDSLSCLHTIEHIGLGRYGDKVDPNGHKKSFCNLIKILKKNGILYISIPISKKNAVFFNAERRFNPLDILSWSDKVELKKFDYIDDNDNIHEDVKLLNFDYNNLFNGLGIYTLKKINN